MPLATNTSAPLTRTLLHTDTHTHTHTQTHTHIHSITHAHTHTHTHTHSYTLSSCQIHTRTHTCTRARTRTCTHARTRARTHAHPHTLSLSLSLSLSRSHTHTHTHTHTNTNTQTHHHIRARVRTHTPGRQGEAKGERVRAPARVGSIQLQVSFAEHYLFYRSLLQKRPIISSILLPPARVHATEEAHSFSRMRDTPSQILQFEKCKFEKACAHTLSSLSTEKTRRMRKRIIHSHFLRRVRDHSQVRGRSRRRSDLKHVHL